MRSQYVVGIDEAGRGPLAGPVTVAFMACPERLARKIFKNIRDSKKLSAKKREEWFNVFKTRPELTFATASARSSVVDNRGITKAINIAIKKLFKKLPVTPRIVLLDGNLYAPPEFRQKTIIRGDEKIPVISAASIVAKVTRDRAMIQLAKKFPNYGLETHKGYGTVFHREQIKRFGLSKIHRRTFCRNILS